MPRTNPLRSVQSERALADRIAYERALHGWTYEETARRLTEVGCAMQTTGVYKIEKGKPRRRITVDELVGFAEIFDVDVENLLAPVEIAQDAEARELIERVKSASLAAKAAIEETNEGVHALIHFAARPDLSESTKALVIDYAREFSINPGTDQTEPEPAATTNTNKEAVPDRQHCATS